MRAKGGRPSSPSDFLRCARLQAGKRFATRAPTRSGSNLFVRLCRSTRPSAARKDVALRLRTRSIARSLARTIVTCTKSAPPRTLAPQTSAPKNKEAVLGRLCFWSSPTQVPTAEGPENKEGGTPPDYVFRGPRPPAPPSLPLYSTVLRGGGTWVGLPSARRLGGYCVVAQAHLWLMRHLQTVQAVYHCLYPSISIGRVFRYRVS